MDALPHASIYLKAEFFLYRSLSLTLNTMHCIPLGLQHRHSATALSSFGSTQEQSKGARPCSHG